ncbi:MAG: ATP-binding protein [Deltaproteobacteria bacterium]|nr:ATP-binding protein [Deltaproteobacteria bacterium]
MNSLATHPSLPTPSTNNTQPPSRLLKRLSYLMLVRVVLFTLLLGGTVGVHFAWQRPEALGGPYVSVLFIFIAAIYILNIVYAAAIRLGCDLRYMAMLQIGVDLVTSAVLVHFTGSAESAFVLFFLLTPVAAAITLSRRATLITLAAGLVLMGLTIVLGHLRLIPMLQGQKLMETPTVEVARSLLLNAGAMTAVAALSGYLADLLHSAASEAAKQWGHFADLEALHEDVVRCLTSGLITIDRGGSVVTANDAAYTLLKAQEDTLMGHSLADTYGKLFELTQGPSIRPRQEVALMVNHEHRHFGVSISPLTNRDQQQIGQIINFQDLTRFKSMEQTAQRAEQLAALGRVAAGVAHEIRNPLASISGSLELLASEQDLSAEGKKLTSIAQREIERLNRLISELLDYARARRSASLETMDLHQAIPALVASVSGLMQSNAASPQVIVEQDAHECWIAGDLDLLTGMLWNLVRNAWEANEEEQITVSVSRTDDEAVLEVRDQGEGIPAEQLEHIFEPFFSTKSKGNGLGLAIVHRGVLDHGARIEVESVESVGTTFRIFFPRIQCPSSEE